MSRRRNLLGLTAAGALAAVVLVTASSVGARRASADPATWKPWHLTSASQLRLPAPPAATSATTKKDLAQLRRYQKQRTPKTLAAIKKWNGQPAVLPWTDVFLQAVQNYRPRPPFASFGLAIFYTGLHDAMVAAYDSRDAYAAKTRPAPSKLDARIKPVGKAAAGSTYAPVQAAMAGAAETILPYFFPDAPAADFHRMATEAVNSRLWAGLNYSTDVQRARLLGQKVAQAVIAHAQTDGRATATGFPSPKPVGEGYWTTTPPGFETPFGGPVGLWRPWLMSSGSQFLHAIPGPSTYGSPQFMEQLMAVINTLKTETDAQRKIAFFWDDGSGTLTPPGHWVSITATLIKRYHTTNAQAVRILSLVGAAEADAAVAAWGMKYTYWSIRPVSAVWRLGADGKLLTEAQCIATPSLCPYRNAWYPLITTPAFPSYPSGHATFSGAAATVLSYFFPAASKEVKDMAAEAAQSRLYAGIHFPEDNQDGLILGQRIGGLAIERAKTDGAG
jgi:membrane-associated phospholipid phosphatase